jgi:hypothetical protein
MPKFEFVPFTPRYRLMVVPQARLPSRSLGEDWSPADPPNGKPERLPYKCIEIKKEELRTKTLKHETRMKKLCSSSSSCSCL